ncbi:MAG: cell wall biogenesis protein [Caeruleum heppii]|nr:MAG: cell wall biogenesis protein [Caeruleum heppii]
MALTPSPAAPATPLTQPLPATHETPTTGTWRHPRFDEIARRQNAASFTDRNIRKALVNAALLVGTWIMARAVKNRYDGGQPRSSFITIDLDSSNTSTVQILAAPVHLFISYSPYSIWALRLFLLFNIVMAFYPLIRPPDDLADIPLTPTQRARLGLSPTPMTPTTPSGQYITPPRYPRSATPQSGTPNSTKSRYSNSPYSANGSPSPAATEGDGRRRPEEFLRITVASRGILHFLGGYACYAEPDERQRNRHWLEQSMALRERKK